MMRVPTHPRYRPFPQDSSMKGSRAYLHCRVAHNDGFSLELQKKELLQFAVQAGFEIVSISRIARDMQQFQKFKAVEKLKKTAEQLAKNEPTRKKEEYEL